MDAVIISNILIFLVLVVNAECTVAKSTPTVNFVTIHEDEKSQQLVDNVIKYMQETYQDEVNIGQVHKLKCHELSLCSNKTESEFEKLLKKEESPDFVIDLTENSKCGLTIKHFLKYLRFPTVFPNHDQNFMWKGLSTDEHNYLVQSRSPADVLWDAIVSVAHERIIELAYLNYNNIGYIYNGIKREFKLDKETSADVCADIERAANTKGIRNFFIVGSRSTSSIDDVLNDLSKSLNVTYFGDEFAWYSLSLASNPPRCAKGVQDLKLLHLSPIKRTTDGNEKNVRPGITSESGLMDLYHFDVVVNAVLAVAKLKRNDGENVWVKSPTESCSNRHVETPYQLKFMSEFQSLMHNGSLNLLGSYASNAGIPESQLRLNMDSLIFQAGNHEGVSITSRGVATWDSEKINRRGDYRLRILDYQAWGEHKAIQVLTAVTVLDPPYVMNKNPQCEGNYSTCFEGLVVDIISNINQDLNKIRVVVKHLKTQYGERNQGNPSEWTGAVGALMAKKVDIGMVAMAVTEERSNVLDLVPFMKNNQTNETYALAFPRDSLWVKPFTHMVKKLINQRYIEQLQEVWLVEYPGNFTQTKLH